MSPNVVSKQGRQMIVLGHMFTYLRGDDYGPSPHLSLSRERANIMFRLRQFIRRTVDIAMK